LVQSVENENSDESSEEEVEEVVSEDGDILQSKVVDVFVEEAIVSPVDRFDFMVFDVPYIYEEGMEVPVPGLEEVTKWKISLYRCNFLVKIGTNFYKAKDVEVDFMKSAVVFNSQFIVSDDVVINFV